MRSLYRCRSYRLCKTWLVVLFTLVGLNARGEEQRSRTTDTGLNETSAIRTLDQLVQARQREQGIEPADPCSDEVFVRRIFLDTIGTLPTAQEARDFLQNQRPDKRAALIDALLDREEFADYWTLKWCDVLRVKSEFPINLWPNAVQAYHRWIHDAIRRNQPYDQFARELLTSSGSNFRVPPANFYRAIQGREPLHIAGAVALTLMGTRLDKWPEPDQKNLAAFFSRVAYKQTDEWKEEIVYSNFTSTTTLTAVFPDGGSVQIAPDMDPREVFADWLTAPGNPWFARAVANRVWAWLLGRGIIHESDDIRPDNPPVNPELLAFLESELVNSHYDLRHLYRLILKSSTYQQSSIPRSAHPQAEILFAQYPVRRLEAEVLIDALCQVTGTGEGYTSAIPEPFTVIPEDQRSITLADGSISSSFLQMFGRPARDSGLESERNNQPTAAQRLYLLNSTDLQRRIANSPWLRNLMATHGGNRRSLVETLYLTVLSRYPTRTEMLAMPESPQASGQKPVQALGDLMWALINTKEFLYRH